MARNRRTASIRPITAPTITPVLSLLESGLVSSVGRLVDCVGELVMMTEDDDWCGVVVGVGCWRKD